MPNKKELDEDDYDFDYDEKRTEPQYLKLNNYKNMTQNEIKSAFKVFNLIKQNRQGKFIGQDLLDKVGYKEE